MFILLLHGTKIQTTIHNVKHKINKDDKHILCVVEGVPVLFVANSWTDNCLLSGVHLPTKGWCLHLYPGVLVLYVTIIESSVLK